MVPIKQFNRQSLGSLAIGSFDHTEIIVLLRMMRTRQLRKWAAVAFFVAVILNTRIRAGRQP
jgi:hypothetical protein